MNPSSALILSLLLFPFANCFAQAQVVIINEPFDTVVPPDLPIDWVGSPGWSTSSSSESPSSGGNNLAHTGSGSGTILFPTIDLSIFSSGFIFYNARRTSSYDQNNLALTASDDGGVTYSISVISPGQALPSATSSYQSISVPLPVALFGKAGIMLRFEALGGTSSGSNIRIDDLVVTGTVGNEDSPPGSDSTAQSSQFGFQEGSSSVLEQTEEVVIPLTLSVVTSLRGLQFDLALTGSNAAFLGIERGSALLDTTSWTVDWNTTPTSSRVLILSNDSALTTPGVYEDFLSLRLSTSPLSGDLPIVESLILSGIVAAVEPDSSGIESIGANIVQHALTILQREAIFQADLSNIDFGVVSTDSSSQKTLIVSNVNGTTDLIVSNISSSNPLFSIASDSLIIPAGESFLLDINFTPTKTIFGFQTASLLLTHNGNQAGQSIVPLAGTGIGGRGDANVDGTVDVGDVLFGIDTVLGLTILSSPGQDALDVYPEFAGDSALDVRDLGTLVEAILAQTWADGAPLPINQLGLPTQPDVITQQSLPSSERALAVELQQLDGLSFQIWIHVNDPIRGLELSISNVAQADVSAMSSPETKQKLVNRDTGQYLSKINTRLDQHTKSLRILMALSAGNELGAGSYSLGTLNISNKRNGPTVDRAIAYNGNLNRVSVDFDVTSTATAITPNDETPTTALNMPYPNPWKLGISNTLRIPFRIPPSGHKPSFEVYDILGRSVETSGATASRTEWKWSPPKGQLVPGLYFVRMKTGDQSFSRSFSVVR